MIGWRISAYDEGARTTVTAIDDLDELGAQELLRSPDAARLVRGIARIEIVDGIPAEYLAARYFDFGIGRLPKFLRQLVDRAST